MFVDNCLCFSVFVCFAQKNYHSDSLGFPTLLRYRSVYTRLRYVVVNRNNPQIPHSFRLRNFEMFTEDMTIFEIPRSFRLRSGPIMKYKRDDPPTTSFIPVSDDSYFGMINGALTNRSTMEFHFIPTSEFQKVYKTYDHVL